MHFRESKIRKEKTDMCRIRHSTDFSSVVGWKVVIEDKYGNYRSIITGYKYLEGQRPRTPRWLRSPDTHFQMWLITKRFRLRGLHYQPQSEGRTGVFTTKATAKLFFIGLEAQLRNGDFKLRPGEKLKLVKAKLTGKIWGAEAYITIGRGGESWLGDKIWFKDIN